MKRSIISRRLRRDSTPAERRLWSYLRGRQLRGFKFRRQEPIDKYIADFACVEGKLVIELDGSQHGDPVEPDVLRTAAIESAGFLVIRFRNEQVLRSPETVLEEIERVLAARPQTDD